jgi:hypothetical protein
MSGNIVRKATIPMATMMAATIAKEVICSPSDEQDSYSIKKSEGILNEKTYRGGPGLGLIKGYSWPV